MRVLFTLLCMAGFLAVYLWWIRPYLKALPSLAEHFREEDTYWEGFKAWLYGRRTILVGIWGEFIAMGPDALQALSGVDLKTLLSLPDAWAAYITALIPVLMLIFRAKANPPDTEEK